MFQLRLDYVTANFDSQTKEKCSEILSGGLDSFCWRSNGLSETSAQVSPLGLFFLPCNGFGQSTMRFSGVGCEKFALTLPDFRKQLSPTFSRLDFAFDVVMSRQEWRDFLAVAFADSLNSTRKAKRYSLAGDGEAMTIYIGSRRGAKFCRIYNKTLEDSYYVFEDESGREIELSEDQYVIRYELELKRFKRKYSDHADSIYDPSPLFDYYFSSDPSEHLTLIQHIKDIWLSYGNLVLLPEGFEDSEFFLRSVKQKSYFVQSGYSDPLVYVSDQLHQFPHVFDSTLSWIVDRFGAYLPYIICNPVDMNACLDKCRVKFGFAPDLNIYLKNDYSDFGDPESDLPSEFLPRPIEFEDIPFDPII